MRIRNTTKASCGTARHTPPPGAKIHAAIAAPIAFSRPPPRAAAIAKVVGTPSLAPVSSPRAPACYFARPVKIIVVIPPHMDDAVREFRATLESAMRRLQPHVTGARIVGWDMAQFLVVNRDDRGAEVYGNEQSGVIVDPAVGEELQGEITYPSFDLALDAVVRWLRGGSLEEMRPAG